MVKGGFQVKPVDMVLASPLLCFFCHFLMKSAIQTSRGERACTECYEAKKRDTVSGVCPIDGEKDATYFPDKYADKQIGEIVIYCLNKAFGCQEVFQLKRLEEHQNNCNYVTTDCQKCYVKVLLKEIDEHNKNYCTKRKVYCRFCGVQMLFENIQLHEEKCTEKPSVCVYGCGGLVTDGLSIEHSLLCPKILSKEVCQYSPLGCMNQSNHEDNHNVYVVCEIEKLKTENEHLKKTVDKQKDLIESLLLDKQTYLMKNEENDKIIQGLLETTARLERRCDGLSEQLQYQEARVVDSHDRLDIVDTKLASIGGTNSALDSQAVTNCVVKVEQLENSYTLLSKNVADQDLRQQLLENTNYGRRYIWKVDNIQHRTNQAIIGRITALHSAPCFTEKFGYKYCARLYLNGDGIGKSTHLSLFFVVMKSEYDELLNWPFTERITFILRDLDNPSRNIKESFLPDMNSSSFKRPVRDMNVAAGCPMFVSLETLRSGNFIRDNAMFIEIEIGDHKK